MNRLRHPNKQLLVGMTFLNFMVQGMPEGVIGVAWPSIRKTFDLPLDALGSLLVAYTIGFLLSSFNSGRIISRIGVGWLILLGNVIIALGFLGYVLAPSWEVMLALGLLAGLGAGGTDAGLNTYIAANHSARVVSWAHACFGLGATIGPVIMTTVLSLGLSWRYGYVLVAVLRLLLAVSFGLTLARWRTGDRQPNASPAHRVSFTATLSLFIVWLGIVLFVLHAGIELIVGQWSYTLLTESRLVSPEIAGVWVGIYWGSLTAGRVLVGFVPDHIGPVRLIRACIVGVLISSVLLASNVSNELSFVALIFIGLSIAPFYPALVSATPGRVGLLHAANAMGFQISAGSMGGAILPGMTGVLAERFGLEAIGPILIIAAIATLGVHEALVYRASCPSLSKYRVQPSTKSGP